MAHPDIPGFYYDQQRARYFKIPPVQHAHTPSLARVSAPEIERLRADAEVEAEVRAEADAKVVTGSILRKLPRPLRLSTAIRTAVAPPLRSARDARDPRGAKGARGPVRFLPANPAASLLDRELGGWAESRLAGPWSRDAQQLRFPEEDAAACWADGLVEMGTHLLSVDHLGTASSTRLNNLRCLHVEVAGHDEDGSKSKKPTAFVLAATRADSNSNRLHQSLMPTDEYGRIVEMRTQDCRRIGTIPLDDAATEVNCLKYHAASGLAITTPTHVGNDTAPLRVHSVPFGREGWVLRQEGQQSSDSVAAEYEFPDRPRNNDRYGRKRGFCFTTFAFVPSLIPTPSPSMVGILGATGGIAKLHIGGAVGSTHQVATGDDIGDILAVDFRGPASPDVVYAGARGGTVWVGDLRVDPKRWSWFGHGRAVSRLAPLGENQILVAGCDSRMALYDIRYCGLQSRSSVAVAAHAHSSTDISLGPAAALEDPYRGSSSSSSSRRGRRRRRAWRTQPIKTDALENAAGPILTFPAYRNFAHVDLGFAVESSLGIIAAANDDGTVGLHSVRTGRSFRGGDLGLFAAQDPVQTLTFASVPGEVEQGSWIRPPSLFVGVGFGVQKYSWGTLNFEESVG